MTTFAGTIQLALWTKIKNGGMAKVNVTFIWGLLSRSLLFFLVTLNVNFVWSPDILFILEILIPCQENICRAVLSVGEVGGFKRIFFPHFLFLGDFHFVEILFFWESFPHLLFVDEYQSAHVFIGPTSDHCIPLFRNWLTDSLLFSRTDWCDPGVWRCQLKTSWCCYCCWGWWWATYCQHFGRDFDAEDCSRYRG